MNLPDKNLELVRDALYRRDMKYVGFLAFNKASERMEEVGLPILSVLENVIRDEVMPSCPLDPTAQHEAFPGISSLVGGYLQIVKKEGQLERAAEFVSLLSGAVLVEAIRYIGIEWDHVIPGPFLKIVETAAHRGARRHHCDWTLGLRSPQCRSNARGPNSAGWRRRDAKRFHTQGVPTRWGRDRRARWGLHLRGGRRRPRKQQERHRGHAEYPGHHGSPHGTVTEFVYVV